MRQFNEQSFSRPVSGRIEYNFGDGIGEYRLSGERGGMVYFEEVLPPSETKDTRRFYKCGWKRYLQKFSHLKYYVDEHGKKVI